MKIIKLLESKKLEESNKTDDYLSIREINWLKDNPGQEIKKTHYKVSYNNYVNANTNEPIGGHFTVIENRGRDTTRVDDVQELKYYIVRRYHKYFNEDISYEWKPNTSFKHIKDIYNKVKANDYKYVNNEREEFMAAVKRADNKGYKPEECRQIKDWHREIWQKNRKTEDIDYSKFKNIPDLIPYTPVEDNRKWQYSIGGVDVPYTSYEEAKAHLKDDYKITNYRDELQKYIDKETGRPHTFFVDETFDGRLCIDINRGDWKHEHWYADSLVKKFFMDKGLGIEIEEDVTFEDGSDNYSANHYYEIDDIALSGRVVEESLLESNIKHIYYHNDPITSLKKGQWVDVKEEDGKLYGKWSFEGDNGWHEITNVEEMPYHNFHGARPAKTFTWGGWRHWLDDEVEKFWDIEGKSIIGDFEIPGMPHVKRKLDGINESTECKVRFYQVFEAPKSPEENGKMIGQRGTLKDAIAFGEKRTGGRNNFLVKAVCNDGTKKYVDFNLMSDDEINNLEEKLDEASYGGAFDIADDEYFTKDDIVTASEKVLDHVNETFSEEYVLGGTWFENGNWIVNIQTQDGMEEYEVQVPVSMRRIRKPSDIEKYILEVASDLIRQIKEYNGLNESYRGAEGVEIIGHGEWSDPELIYNRYSFNYNDVENLLWQSFLDKTGYKDSQSGEDAVENEFDIYVQSHVHDLLDDMILGGYGENIEESLDEAITGEYSDKFYDLAKEYEEDDNCQGLRSLADDVIRYCPEEDVKDCWWERGYQKRQWDEEEYQARSNADDDSEDLDEDFDGEPLEGPKEGAQAGVADLINDALIDEIEAVKEYNTLSINARAEGFNEIANIVDDINTEENLHIGQLQQALSTISPNTTVINQGEQEARDQMTDSHNPNEIDITADEYPDDEF